MAGEPWLEYQTTENVEKGPWEDYAPADAPAPVEASTPKTPKELPVSEGLAAGYRTAKDEIPYVQTRRREEVYRDLAGKMGKNVVTDYFSPKALIPGREMFGIDSYDYDAVFNDAKKAGLVKNADRASFEKTFLGRDGDRNIDMNTVNQNPISGFIGGIGSMVADPLNVGAGIATGPASVGRSLLGKMGIEGGINAGIEALQLPFTNDALENLGQDMSAEEMAARVAMAGGFGAALSGAGHLLRGKEPQANADGVRPWTEEEMSGITNLIDKGATVDDIAKVFPLTEEQKTAAQFYVDERAKGNDTEVKFEDVTEEPLPFEPPAFLEKPVKGPFKETPDFLGVDIPKNGRAAPVKTAPEAEPVLNLAVNKQQAADHINNTLASDWKNAPRITAVDSLDELPPSVRQSIIDDGAEDAKGVTVDGEVYILSHNLKDIDDLSAVTYHEALGHAGLGIQFGKRLNAVLEQMYNTNEMVKKSADGWLAANSTQSTNPVAHAVEEILAEANENGKIDAKIMAKIKAFLKQYARRVPGLKNLKYTDKEVIAILSMAQNKVVKGNKTFFGTSEARYSKPDNDNTIDLAAKRDEKNLREFGKTFSAEIAERANTKAEQLQVMKDSGLFPLDAGQRILTPKGRELGMKPWKITGYWVDGRDPSKFGYRVEKGSEETGDFEQSILNISDPKADARMKERNPSWDRQKEVDSWVVMGGPTKNKYSKPQEGEQRARGLPVDKILGKKKSFYEPFLKQLEADGQPRVVQTWEETKALAEDIGMNVDKVMKLDRGPKAEEYTAGVNFMMGRMNLIGDLSDKVAAGKATDRDKDKFGIYLRQFADMYDVLSETRTSIARTLNIMNRIVENEKAAANNLRYMLSDESESMLNDPTKIKKLAEKINELKGNPAAQAKAVKMLSDPRFEDYIQDLWFNSVLSNPITHKINLLGSVGNFLTDLSEHAFASVLGQARRGNADRVMAREVLWRFYGAAMGLKGAFGKSAQAFKAGEPVTKIGALERSHNLIKNKYLSAFEGPSKMLAAEDEFMRNIIQTSSYYGMAIRTAAKEGLTGDAMRQRANQLISDPTDEMILTAADYTRALQFVDKPSKPARTYLTLMSRNDADGATARTAKFFGSLFTPFIPTADSIFRSAVRRSPLGHMDRYNASDWAAGGARKDMAKARVLMGSMLAMWVANEVLDGNISGNGPDDYRRRAEMEAGGWRANSIKIDGKWVPFDGLDPLAMNLSMVANAVEDYNEQKVDDKGYTDQAIAAVGGVVRALGTSSWLKSLAFITEGINDARTGQQAVENLALNTATGMVPYSGMGRFMGSVKDPVERDVSADGTMSERFTDRVKSISPFLKDSLPARHDVYGRERKLEERKGLGWLGRHAQTTIDTEPTVVELQRLAKDSGKTLIPPVGKDDAKKYGIERLNSEQYQQYQDYAGDLILAASKEAMDTPEWNDLSDEEKIKEIKTIAKDMRELAREDLFGTPQEEEIPEDEYDDE